MRRSLGLIFVNLLACAPATTATFRATDPTFAPEPGPLPRVYIKSNRAEIPRVKLRSVGVIAITVAKKHGMSRAVELAANKGRELGCWLVIEHSIFEAHAALSFGARAILAHGPPHAPPRARPPAQLTIEFDCVLPASEASATPRGRDVSALRRRRRG